MKIIDRIKARTSKGNRIKGQISTAVGVTCVTILGLGLVTIASPVLFVALTVGGAIFGGKAVQSALKTKP
jgi:hypothetical protein